jgi:hypothetical protein
MTTIESIPAPEPMALRQPRMAPRNIAGLLIWTLVLVAGFALVIGLGSPLVDDRSAVDKAYHPTPPVTEAQAIESADTIVRVDYPQFATGIRSVTHEDTYGDDRFTIVYRMPRQVSGVRISVSVKGSITVSTYP